MINNNCRWKGAIMFEGVWTDDARMIQQGATTWRELPIPLTYGNEQVLVGTVDRIEYDGLAIIAFGTVDPSLIGEVRGAAVFLDKVNFAKEGDVLIIDEARIASVSVVDDPSFPEARIEIIED